MLPQKEYNRPLERKFHFGVIHENKLYRASQPNDEFLKYLKENYGLKTVVALRTEIPESEEKSCKENGIKLIQLPVKSWRRWPDYKELKDFFTLFEDMENLPLLVHCQEAREGEKKKNQRTNVMTALYRIKYDGWDLKKTLDEMKQWGANWFWRLFIQARASKIVDGFEEKRLVPLYLMRIFNLVFGIEGFVFVVRHEKNLQLFLVWETLLLLIPFLLGRLTLLEFSILLALCAFLNTAEIFNTANERSVDIAEPHFNPRVKYVKDILAGGVVSFGVISFVIWIIFVFFLQAG